MAQVERDLENELHDLMGQLIFDYGENLLDIEILVYDMYKIMQQLPDENEVKKSVPFAVFSALRLRGYSHVTDHRLNLS